MQERKTEYFLADIKELVPYARNAKTHSDEQIAQVAASIKEFGFLAPIIVSKDNTILCGHGRFYAAQRLGLSKVPCIKEEYLTESQKRAYIIADNKLTENGGWDNEMLAIELSDLLDDGFDIGLTGFDENEIADLFGADDTSGVQDDDYDLSAALDKASFVKRGDIWTVGRHRLMCGDATSKEDVDALMDGVKANLIVTDPPYNVSFESSDGLSIKNDKMENEKFYEFLLSAFLNMADHLEKGAAAYVFHADTEGLNFRKAFIDAGFHLSGCCIWVKNSLVLGRSDYQWQHEPVLYGFLKNGKHFWSTKAGRSQTTIWNFDKPKKNKEKGSFKAFLKSRKARHGSLAIVIVAVVVAIVIVLNVICGLLVDRFPDLKLDLTANQSFALQDDTIDYVSHLNKDVTLYVLMPENEVENQGTYFIQAKNLLDKIKSNSNGKIDLNKFSPITYDTVHHTYRKLGDVVGKAFSDELKFK